MPPLTDYQAKLERCLIEHPRFEEAKNKILRYLRFPTDKKIVYVIGPSGVGKTRLAEKIASTICADPVLKARIDADPGCIPCISFEVPCISNNGRFAWSSFYHTYYNQLECPLVPRTGGLAPLPMPDRRGTPEDLVLNAVKHRRPMVALLDEANHFANVATGKWLVEQMTRIKSFANRSKVLHVGFGTYELVGLTNLSDQLARRSEIIHFRRYSASEEDLAAFATVVGNFQRTIPVVHHLDLRTHLKYLHERTLGCVGTLKTWLVDALGNADAEGRSAIRLEDLKVTALPLDRLETMLEKAIEGESCLRESTEADLELFRFHLGHTDENPHSSGVQSELWPNQEPASMPKRQRKPFEQSPVRRPTGLGRNNDEERLAS